MRRSISCGVCLWRHAAPHSGRPSRNSFGLEYEANEPCRGIGMENAARENGCLKKAQRFFLFFAFGRGRKLLNDQFDAAHS